MFEKYQHNKELVALVNLFAEPSNDLPEGWDTKKDRNGKVQLLARTFVRLSFYSTHCTCFITFSLFGCFVSII